MGQKKRVLYLFIGVGVLFLLAVGGGVYYMMIQLQDVTENVNEPLQRGEFSAKREITVDPEIDNISVLFMGLDNRDHELYGLSDAMVFATFNREEGTVKSLSIPRDSHVSIPGRSEGDKINHAHAFGGTDLAVATVENLLDVPVDYYVSLNFDAFMEIIDIFGGVDVDVPFDFSEQDADGTPDAIELEEGKQTLNGEEALAYVRMRYQDPMGDFGRNERQQEVLKSLIEEATSLPSLVKYNKAFQQLEENMNFNFSFDELVALQFYARSLEEIETYQLKGDEHWQNGVYYFEVEDESLAEVSAELREHMGLEEDEGVSEG